MTMFSRYVSWAGTTQRRLLALLAIGAIIGVSGASVTFSFRPAVQKHSVSALIYQGYVGLLIDRTRTDWCDVEPSRTAYQDVSFNGEELPFAIPLNSQSLVWPVLGRQKFILGVVRVKDLAPGKWSIALTQRSRCNWYNYLIGPDVTVSTASVVVPSVPSQGQAQ